MIDDKISKSLLGLVTLFIAATMIGWGAVRFDNYLVDVLKLSSTSIIITEALILASFIIIYLVVNTENRRQFIKDVKKLGVKEWSIFMGLSLIGVYIALMLNRSLRHWDTAEFRMTGEIVKIVLGGILFFIFTKEDWSYKKLSAFIVLAISAVYFNII